MGLQDLIQKKILRNNIHRNIVLQKIYNKNYLNKKEKIYSALKQSDKLTNCSGAGDDTNYLKLSEVDNLLLNNDDFHFEFSKNFNNIYDPITSHFKDYIESSITQYTAEKIIRFSGNKLLIKMFYYSKYFGYIQIYIDIVKLRNELAIVNTIKNWDSEKFSIYTFNTQPNIIKTKVPNSIRTQYLKGFYILGIKKINNLKYVNNYMGGVNIIETNTGLLIDSEHPSVDSLTIDILYKLIKGVELNEKK